MQRTKVATACLAALFAICSAYAQDAAFSVTVAKSTKTELNADLTAFARVEPDPQQSVTLIAPVNGTLQVINVLAGDRVVSGEVVAAIVTDPVLLAQTKAADDTLRYAKESLAHQERLFAQQLATRDQVDAARRDVSIAAANLAAAKRLGSDQRIVQVLAPVEGKVSSLAVTPGQQVLQGTAIATITNPGALIVRPGVEPGDSRRIRPGDPVVVVAVTDPSEKPDEPVALSITSVGSTVDPLTRLVPIIIMITGEAASKFIEGQTVRVTFAAGKGLAITVPRAALEYEGGNAIVFVVVDGKARKREIKLAGTTDSEIFVAEGLEEGESVIVDGLSGLTDGAVVKVAP